MDSQKAQPPALSESRRIQWMPGFDHHRDLCHPTSYRPAPHGSIVYWRRNFSRFSQHCMRAGGIADGFPADSMALAAAFGRDLRRVAGCQRSLWGRLGRQTGRRAIWGLRGTKLRTWKRVWIVRVVGGGHGDKGFGLLDSQAMGPRHDLSLAGVFGDEWGMARLKCFRKDRKRAKNKGGSAVNGFRGRAKLADWAAHKRGWMRVLGVGCLRLMRLTSQIPATSSPNSWSASPASRGWGDSGRARIRWAKERHTASR